MLFPILPFLIPLPFFPHPFLPLPPLFLGDLKFPISHPFPYPLHSTNSIFSKPASFSPHISLFLTVPSPRSRAHLSFFHLCFPNICFSSMEVDPSFKHQTRQGYVQGEPMSLCSHTQEVPSVIIKWLKRLFHSHQTSHKLGFCWTPDVLLWLEKDNASRYDHYQEVNSRQQIKTNSKTARSKRSRTSIYNSIAVNIEGY